MSNAGEHHWKSISDLSERKAPSRSSSSGGRRPPSRSFSTGSRRLPQRTSSRRSTDDFAKVQTQLNEANVKHNEEMYWLQLELNTTRKAKSSMEDRMAEMYRELQTLQDRDGGRIRQRPVDLTPGYVSGLNAQLDKYERIFRLSNKQISIVRAASDDMVKSLKDEIRKVSDEKRRMELELLNKITGLEDSNRKLKETALHQQQLAKAAGSRQQESPVVIQSSPETVSARDDDRNLDLKKERNTLKEENVRLSNELKQERSRANSSRSSWKRERASLLNQIAALKKDAYNLQSSPGTDAVLLQMSRQKEEIQQILDRVTLVSDSANESVHGLENTIAQLQRASRLNATSARFTDKQEQTLSTLETASLVQGQVKVSLLLIELKLRNCLASLGNDNTQFELDVEGSDRDDRVNEAHTQAMNAIAEVEQKVGKQLQELRQQSEEESQIVKETLELKVKELARMQNRQAELEAEIAEQAQTASSSLELKSASNGTSGDEEIFVSRVVLERLQSEVLQVVGRVQEKNEEIERLTATVEEHRIRERTLMEELKRHVQEQGERQLQEQQRLLEQARLQESSDEEDVSSDYEEIIEEETVVEDITVYEEI